MSGNRELNARLSEAGILWRYTATLAIVAVSALIGMLVAPRWGNSPVDLLFLPAVLAAAAFYGLGPGVLAAAASTLAFNYFFTHPYHTFRVTSPTDIATVGLLFLVAVVTSQLAARMRAEARHADILARRNAYIAGLARRLLSASSDEQVAEVACREIGRLFVCKAVLLAGKPELHVISGTANGLLITVNDSAVAARAMYSGGAVGQAANATDESDWFFYPVPSDAPAVAVLGLMRDDRSRPVNESQQALLGNLLDQVALALERAKLEKAAREFTAVRERDRVRSALLSSIGEDMHPRISAISSAVNALLRARSLDKRVLSSVRSEVTKLDSYLHHLQELGFESDDKAIEIGEVTIDLFHRTVIRNGQRVRLTPKEYAILAEMAKQVGRVLSHSQLLRAAWGPAHEGQIDYLRVAIRSLRQKLEVDPARPSLIINEPAVGYRLVGSN